MVPPLSHPTRRAILLGASNLHHGLPSLVGTLAQAHGAAVETWAAAGHGRSYGGSSRFAFVRGLPGILESPLWGELAARTPLPTLAWITDVGNDLLYGAPVEAILRWVETALGRLEVLEARTVVNLLPMARIERLTSAQFITFRTLFFPGRRASWEGTLARARVLQEGLREVAQGKGAATLEPPLDWYGVDPIHIRRGRFPTVWHELLRLWGLSNEVAREPLPYRGLRISSETRLLGLPIAWPQPAVRFADGSRLYLR